MSEDERNSAGDLTHPKKENKVFKRVGKPPRNKHNKMICEVVGCEMATFDRRCEWNKHMDRHDRPYKCLSRQCGKVDGFTYNGGLERHKREVHKMCVDGKHKRILCPVPNCKRASNGFTRKENLEEHLRRLHSGDKERKEGIGKDANMEDVQEANMGLGIEDEADREMGIRSTKRKRGKESYDWDKADLWDEIKQLKKDNEDICTRVRALEAVFAKSTTEV